MTQLAPTTTVVYQFASKNILIKPVGPHQHTFSFDGDEDQFIVALTQVMDDYGYRKQDVRWFPGDPCGGSDNAYYIEGIWEDPTYISLNWNTKEVCIS
jgi:hypothetical protein